MRAGLDAAGWRCVLAIDNDPDMVAVHRLAHATAVQADVTELTTQDIPDADVWVAGFPCSTSILGMLKRRALSVPTLSGKERQLALTTF